MICLSLKNIETWIIGISKVIYKNKGLPALEVLPEASGSCERKGMLLHLRHLYSPHTKTPTFEMAWLASARAPALFQPLNVDRMILG